MSFDSEREAFEANIGLDGHKFDFKRDGSGYADDNLDTLWQGWQARAQAGQVDPDYQRGYSDALAHAAMYVLDHCQQGAEHAECISTMKRPDGQVERQSVPEGWKLVPIVPTEEMITAKPKSPGVQGQSCQSMQRNADIAKYAAMIAAAPQPESKP